MQLRCRVYILEGQTFLKRLDHLLYHVEVLESPISSLSISMKQHQNSLAIKIWKGNG